jgi:hypothetical protein
MKSKCFLLLVLFLFSTILYGVEFSSWIGSIRDYVFEENEIVFDMTKAQQKDEVAVEEVKPIPKFKPKHEIKVIDLRKDRLDSICQDMIDKGYVFPVEHGPHIWFGKKVSWVVNNFVKADGWQLSGWSKIKLDSNFNVHRFKFGYISPEIYGPKAMWMHEHDVNRRDFIRWKEMETDPVFGFSYSFDF